MPEARWRSCRLISPQHLLFPCTREEFQRSLAQKILDQCTKDLRHRPSLGNTAAGGMGCVRVKDFGNLPQASFAEGAFDTGGTLASVATCHSRNDSGVSPR